MIELKDLSGLAALLSDDRYPADPKPQPPNWWYMRHCTEESHEDNKNTLEIIQDECAAAGVPFTYSIGDLPELSLQDRVLKMEYEQALKDWRSRHPSPFDRPLALFQSPVTVGDFTVDGKMEWGWSNVGNPDSNG